MSEPLTEADLRRWCRELGYWWAPEVWQDADGIYAGNTFMRLRGSPLPPMRGDRRQFKNTVAGLLDWLGWLSKGGVTLPGVVAHVHMCRAHLRESLYALDREVDQCRPGRIGCSLSKRSAARGGWSWRGFRERTDSSRRSTLDHTRPGRAGRGADTMESGGSTATRSDEPRPGSLRPAHSRRAPSTH